VNSTPFPAKPCTHACPHCAEPSPLQAGEILHGFCNGVFGRDSYECKRVTVSEYDSVQVITLPSYGRGYHDSAEGRDNVLRLMNYEGRNRPQDGCNDACGAGDD
jgi:hypothetical protein